MTAVTAFGREKFGAQIRLFKLLYCQKQLKMKILIKNDILILDFVLTRRTLYLKTKFIFLKQSIFVQT